jgi:hypothetical protein
VASPLETLPTDRISRGPVIELAQLPAGGWCRSPQRLTREAVVCHVAKPVR